MSSTRPVRPSVVWATGAVCAPVSTYFSGTNASPLFGFIGITSWFAPAS
jgi:hypothetical protein